MNDDPVLEDPTNRIVSVFDNMEQATTARQDLMDHGLASASIRWLQGAEQAAHVDTSAKWFADTDEEIRKFQRELQAGHIVLSVPVGDKSEREQLHTILKRHQARFITHFGEWITEVLR